jgi:mono/diheme cytochrome c family protein/cbb3-type cytochrome oxidase cytochrome c subunit
MINCRSLFPLFAFAVCLCGQDIKLETGLRLTLSTPNSGSDIRSVSRPALFVKVGQSPSAFLDCGTFSARWEGFLHLDTRSRLYFSFSGTGKAKLSIGGEDILFAEGMDLSGSESERIRLNSGDHPMVLEYDSLGAMDASIRLYWRGREFARETLPASSFLRTPELTEGDILRKGRTLFAESSCIRCHEDPQLVGPDVMPELARRAPSFVGIGSRLYSDWIAGWVANPRHLRASAKMPSLLHLDSVESAIIKKDSRPWDIAAWLATQTGDTPKPLSHSSPNGVNKGRELFYELGCIGCHKVGPEPEGTKDFERLDLTGISNKFKVGALRDFLRNPGECYPWIQMPDFGLSEDEATQLARFLRSLGATEKSKALMGNAKRGGELVFSLGCLNCHEIPGGNLFKAPPLALIVESPDKGCLAQAPDNAPDYGFNPGQISTLKIFLEKGIHSLKRRSFGEFAERQVSALNCNACHSVDGRQNRLSYLPELASHIKSAIGDTEAEALGRKKDPPDLTYIGEKLSVDWMAKLFTGKLDYKPRPWMKMRMPAFPSRGQGLASGLALAHGFSINPPRSQFTGFRVVEGEKLISTNGGFACVACHAVGNKPALAPFEGQGLNFAYSQERLNHEFYMRWMLNPQRLNPLSIMPRYADDEAKTALSDILDGKAHDQFNAIWKYLSDGDL